MLDSAVPQGFPEQVPPTRVMVSGEGAVSAQLPRWNSWNVTVPVGVGPPPPAGSLVTIAWSRTATEAAPARSINVSVTSAPVDALRMCVATDDWNLFTVSGSQVLVTGVR